MRYDWLFEPVSETEPCGPDLDEVGDEDYLNYVLAVSGRIPERYYRADTGKPFDRAEINLKNEVDAIGRLLQRTRDLRLLAIEARFQSFAGELPGFADCIEAISGLVGKFWADVHPKAFEGDFTLRQNGLSGLDDFGQVIQPLQNAPLVRDRKLGPVTFRHFLVADGKAENRPEETPVDLADIHRTLGSDENRATCDLNYQAVVRAVAALSKARETFIENCGYDYVPSFDRLTVFFDQLLTLFHTARPDLAAAAVEAQEEQAAADAGAGEGTASAPRPAPVAGLIKSHSAAAAALFAVEEYFAAHEPSTPALILIHQARTLVGKPLIHALETLLPEAAPRAIIKLQGEPNMHLNMAQLKQLTAGVPKLASSANGATDPQGSYAAATRSEAMTLMSEVEHFYKQAEPSSPVPMLIGKATGYLNRDFGAILKDLIAPVEEVKK